MLKHILDAYGGRLPSDLAVIFANTGMERQETLDFVDTCATAWSIAVHWVEYDWDAPHRTRVVDYATASRRGEPFAALIDRKGFVPNPTLRMCTHFICGDISIKKTMMINLLWRVEFLWSRTASLWSLTSYHN